MNVQEALDNEAFTNAKILAGKDGLMREIRAIDVMEVPDIKDWLTEGVLLLTTFYSLKDDPEKQTDVVKALIKTDAAGLVVKMGRYIQDLPGEVYDIADEQHFPIISVPADIPYVTIMRMLLAAPVAQGGEEDEDLYSSVYKLSQFLDSKIILTNAEHEIISYSDLLSSRQGYFFQVLCGSEDEEFGSKDYFIDKKKAEDGGKIIIPLKLRGQVKGFLHIFAEKSIKMDEIFQNYLEEAKSLILKKMTKYTERVYWQDSYKMERMDALVKEGKPFYTNGDNIVFFTDFLTAEADHLSNLKKNIMLEVFSFLLDEHFGNQIKFGDQHFFVLIKDKKEIDVEEIKGKLSDMVQTFHALFNIDASFYLSKAYNPKTSIKVAVEECLYLMEVKREFQLKESITDNSCLGVYHYLYKLKNDDKTLYYTKDLLKALIEYDKENNQCLMDTLRVYLSNNGNQKKTAELLFIHRRTLMYRLKRIAEITRIDLQNGDDRLMLDIALRLIYSDVKAGR